MKLISWTALLLAVAANIGANAAFKTAVASVSAGAAASAPLQLLRSGYLWIGLTLAAVLLVSFLVALRQIPVSVAYLAISALATVGLVVVDSALFGLKLGLHNVLGMALVIAGLALALKGVR